MLEVMDPRFARQNLRIESADAQGAGEVALALEPAKIIEGRVTSDGNGKPVPNAVLTVHSSTQKGVFNRHADFRADAEGRFRMNPRPGDDFMVTAYPPAGQPYLNFQKRVDWPKGAVQQEIAIALPRGVLIRGKVTEAGTGRPVAGSSVQYHPRGRRAGVVSGGLASVVSGADGSYQIAVLPGAGHLFVHGPNDGYVHTYIAEGLLTGNRPDGRRFYADAILTYDVQPDSPPVEVSATLRPGETVEGRVVGPEGQTVDEVTIIANIHVEPIDLFWGRSELHARDGRFALHGLDAQTPARLYFLDAEHQWGATIELSSKQAGTDLTVRLQPCGQAKARFVGPDGKPVARHSPHFEILATTGPPWPSRDDAQQAVLSADAAYVPNVDRKNYRNVTTDSEGRLTLPDLIPGALYRVSDFSTVNEPNKRVQVRKDFTVKPGETLDLGDILIEQPRP